MKNFLRPILQLMLLALAFLSFAAFAQNSEVRSVDKFTKIANSTSGDVYLKQGSPQKIELVGKKEIIAHVETEVVGGRLKIHVKNGDGNWFWNHDNNNNFKIFITAENIDAIDLNGSGDLTTQGKLVGTNLELNINGSGDVAAEVELNGQMNANIAGSGDIKLNGKFQNAKSQINGSGDIDMNAVVVGTAEFDVSGSGEIKASGRAQTLVASISGSGDLDAADFEADKCKIHVSGSGDAHVNVKSALEARTSGSGEISYRGNPAQVDTHNSGSGNINHTM